MAGEEARIGEEEGRAEETRETADSRSHEAGLFFGNLALSATSVKMLLVICEDIFYEKLPGRTSNEIKNFWNTRKNRCKRDGLPIYPPKICSQVPIENKQSHNAGTTSSGNKLNYDEIVSDIFEDGQGDLSDAPFPDLSFNSFLRPGCGSQSYAFMNPTILSETSFPQFHDEGTNVLSTFEQYEDDNSEKIEEIFGQDLPQISDPSTELLPPFSGTVLVNHAQLNDNFSASNSLHASNKLQLPSIQYPDTCPFSWHELPLSRVDSGSGLTSKTIAEEAWFETLLLDKEDSTGLNHCTSLLM